MYHANKNNGKRYKKNKSTELKGNITKMISNISLGLLKLGFSHEYKKMDDIGANVNPNTNTSFLLSAFSSERQLKSRKPTIIASIIETKM
jgi:hypothetical protein